MKVVSIVSARPNFVKLASLVHAIDDENEKRKTLRQSSGQAPNEKLDHVIIHTGQHYDLLLSDVFFQELGIPPPNENLEVKGGVSNEDTIMRTRAAALPVLKKLKPDLVLVYGDVSGALGGAQAAHELQIPVAHIEAGLRSFDDSMPEEGNRKAIDHLAQLLFVTEKSGIKNLEDENVTEGVHFVGNTMIDTLIKMMPRIQSLPKPFTAAGEIFAVATIHRPSNVDQKQHLERVMSLLNAVARNINVILPMHPRLRQNLCDSGAGMFLIGPNIFAIDPLGYLEFIHLMRDAVFIITDSGGIQEEATFLGKRCFTLRKNTERPSTVEAESNILIDLEKSEDREKVLSYAADPKAVPIVIPPLWDGHAGTRIISICAFSWSQKRSTPWWGEASRQFDT